METIIQIDLATQLSVDYIRYIKQAYQIDGAMDACFHDNPSMDNYALKMHNLGERKYENLDKFIVYIDQELLGYIKYHIDNEYVIVDSIWGKEKDKISPMLRELRNKKYRFDSNMMCNYNIENILNEEAKVITIDEFKQNPELLNNLTKEQLKEVLYRMNQIEDKSDLKKDDSLDDVTFEETGETKTTSFQKTLSNGHSVIENDKSTQGFVDALVLALLSGFVSGILFTIVILFIKIKTGM